MKSLFNFIIESAEVSFRNPCDTPILRKIFKAAKLSHWMILEKDMVDEIIFKSKKARNRLIIELMARGGMRISEVLNLTASDVEDRKLIIRDAKSGKVAEQVFIPQKIADRLKEFIQENRFGPDDRIFPMAYAGVRAMVVKAGNRVGIKVRPHGLRRFSATYASRSGTPLEIISKIILRHANLSTTQRYLGKVSDSEALRWIENLYA